MRAWQVTRNDAPRAALRSADIGVPEPGPGEVRIRVRAAAVGMPDAFMCRGSYAFRPALPFVAGQEVCGTIDAIGADVDLAPGTRVMAVTSFYAGHGGFAEHALARADAVFPAPEGMRDEDAAAFRIGYSTAWIGLVRRGSLVPGDWLLVLGAAGGSGATAVRLGHALGARVIAVARGDHKVALCRALGADVVIDRTRESVADAVRAATGDRGVDLVYDPVGGDGADATVDLLARDGRILAVGFASGRWVAPDLHHLVRRNGSVVGVYAGGYSRAENDADHDALLALAAAGHLGGVVTTVLGFDDLPEAVTLVDEGRAVGKVVVRVSPDHPIA